MQKIFTFNEILLFYIDFLFKKIYAIKKSLAVLNKNCDITFCSFAWQVITCFLDIFLLFLKICLIVFLPLKLLGQGTCSGHHNLPHLRLRHHN